MKKMYFDPMVEIMELSTADVIQTSGGTSVPTEPTVQERLGQGEYGMADRWTD